VHDQRGERSYDQLQIIAGVEPYYASISDERDGFRTPMQYVMFGGRELFKTEKGFLGIGLLGMELGMETWMLEDATTSFMLGRSKFRAPSRHWRRLLGFMHGEMLDKRWGVQVGEVCLI
jgi:hypothetical protein